MAKKVKEKKQKPVEPETAPELPKEEEGRIQTMPSNDPESFEFSGSVGGPFCIYGSGFGKEPSDVTINKVHVTDLTAWTDTFIKGVVPSRGLKHGPATAVFTVGDTEYEIEGRI